MEYEIKGLYRKEIPRYPEEAYREAIVNAIMHRDYFDDSGDILIETFRNKLTISNPGGLIKSIDPEEFGKVSRTRNPLIANLLSRTKYVERVGTGIKRIRDAMNKAKLLPPEFKFSSSFFVTLYDKTYLKEREKTSEKTSEKILAFIKENPKISAKEISDRIKISSRAVEMQIAKLKEEKKIQRIGPAKGGYWEIMGAKHEQ